jgi:hypothetical protein
MAAYVSDGNEGKKTNLTERSAGAPDSLRLRRRDHPQGATVSYGQLGLQKWNKGNETIQASSEEVLWNFMLMVGRTAGECGPQ